MAKKKPDYKLKNPHDSKRRRQESKDQSQVEAPSLPNTDGLEQIAEKLTDALEATKGKTAPPIESSDLQGQSPPKDSPPQEGGLPDDTNLFGDPADQPEQTEQGVADLPQPERDQAASPGDDGLSKIDERVKEYMSWIEGGGPEKGMPEPEISGDTTGEQIVDEQPERSEPVEEQPGQPRQPGPQPQPGEQGAGGQDETTSLLTTIAAGVEKIVQYLESKEDSEGQYHGDG